MPHAEVLELAILDPDGRHTRLARVEHLLAHHPSERRARLYRQYVSA